MAKAIEAGLQRLSQLTALESDKLREEHERDGRHSAGYETVDEAQQRLVETAADPLEPRRCLAMASEPAEQAG